MMARWDGGRGGVQEWERARARARERETQSADRARRNACSNSSSDAYTARSRIKLRRHIPPSPDTRTQAPTPRSSPPSLKGSDSTARFLFAPQALFPPPPLTTRQTRTHAHTHTLGPRSRTAWPDSGRPAPPSPLLGHRPALVLVRTPCPHVPCRRRRALTLSVASCVFIERRRGTGGGDVLDTPAQRPPGESLTE